MRVYNARSTHGTAAAVEIRVPLAERYLRIDAGRFGRRQIGYAADEAADVRHTPIEMPGLPEALDLDATGETFAAHRVRRASHLPVRLVFRAGDRTVPSAASADRRSAAGMNVPYRIVTTAGDRIADELTFDKVAVKPSLTKADFIRWSPTAIESIHGGYSHPRRSPALELSLEAGQAGSPRQPRP